MNKNAVVRLVIQIILGILELLMVVGVFQLGWTYVMTYELLLGLIGPTNYLTLQFYGILKLVLAVFAVFGITHSIWRMFDNGLKIFEKGDW